VVKIGDMLMENPAAVSLLKGNTATTEETPIRVLYVDDEVGLLKAAKRILEMQGVFRVESASSVKEAKEKMEAKTFDVIVSDYIMPGKDGLEFLRELRESGNSIPFIVFTGKGREIVAIKALNLGADQYVNKIGNPETVYSELAHGIRTAVKGKKAEEALRDSEKERIVVLDSMSELVIHQDLKHRILWANRKAADSVTMKPEELKGRYCHEIWAKRAAPCTDCPLEASIKTGQPQQGEITTPDGRVWSINGSLIKDEDGNVTSVVEVVTNITEHKKAEIALQESEEKYRRMIEHAPDLIVTVDEKGIVTSCNGVLEKNTDFSQNEVVGKHFLDTPLLFGIAPETAQTVFTSIIEGKSPERIELKWFLKDRTPRISEIRIGINKNDGKIAGFTAVARDITENKKAEENLQESEEKFRNLAEKSPNMIFINKKGRVVYANNRCEEVMGYKREEFYSPDFNFFTLIAPESIELLKSSYSRHLKGEEMPPYEYTLITKEGKRIEAILTSKLITYEGEPAILGIITDITEHKRVAAELRREKELMEMVTANTAAGLVIISKDFHILWANRLLTEHLGDIRGKVCYSTLNNMTNVCPGCGVKDILETGKNKVVHEQLVHGSNGQKIWLEITAIPIRDKNGNLIAVSEMSIDVTQKKKAEEALRESEEKYRTVFENTGTATCILEDDKTISMVNRRFEELSCYSWKELVGKKWTEFVTKDYLERMKRYHEARRKQGGKAPTNYSFNFVNKNGQIKNCLLTVNMIAGTKKSVASILDLTELKQTEKALRETEEKYRETILNANVGIICHGPEGEVNVLNPKMEQLTGFTISEIPTLHDWFEKVYPNEKERRKIRGTWFKRMSEEGEVKEGHATITTKDGQRRNFLFNGVRLESGDSIAFAIDITESTSAWESLDETINALMTINEKLNVVGRLTRHDVRNKLSVIANNVYLAKQKLAANHSALEYLGDIESAIDQMEKIFEFSRNYEMLGVEELSYIDVKKNVDEAAILLSGLSTVKLVNECKGLTVMADSLLRQLFYNLIDNTLKYGEKVSRIRLYYEEEAEQLKLVYDDDGVGIAEKEKEKIFCDEYGRGTGYGLYLIRKICENYGWTIQETGVPGKGAQFTMTIPKVNNNGESLYVIS
jgi:PAS domain S-box-containing protein